MTVESRTEGGTIELPEINGLRAERIRKVWIYGGGMLILDGSEIKPADTAKKLKMCPGKGLLSLSRVCGWRVNLLSDGIINCVINCVVERDGGEFGALYCLTDTGRVEAITVEKRAVVFGSGREYVFIPVAANKYHRGGILVVGAGELQTKQNIGCINGFLK